LAVSPLPPDGLDIFNQIEVGRRAQGETPSSSSVSYTAYWTEAQLADDGEFAELYHPITADQAPGSDSADGTQHTYMLLANGDDAPWDVLFDYNTVGTTDLRFEGSTRRTSSGMAVTDPGAVTMTTPVELRLQVMDPSGLWRRPHLGELGTSETRTCEAPPRYDDRYARTPSQLPNCFTASYTVQAGVPATSQAEVNTFTIGKPPRPTALSGGATAAPQSSAPKSPTGFHNGVDQQKLAACIADGTRNCLAEVPGLAACVEARAICNITGRQSQKKASISSAPMTAAEAVEAAKKILHIVEPAKATVTTRQQDDRQVHVVTSGARVRSMSASTNDRVYTGYTAEFEVSSGRMISARLGTGSR
jgi:hypothetical protein